MRVQRGMRSRLRTAALEPSPDIEAVFRWLGKRNIQVVLLSNYGIEQTGILLNRLGWAVGPDALITAAVVDIKNQANPVHRALEVAGLSSPGAAIVVVDTPDLLDAAARCHVNYSFGVTSGLSSYQTLQGHACRALLDNPVQLVNYLVTELPGLAEVRNTAA